MKNITISGLQYGDEGKGKIIDLISYYYDLNIRNNGGHNAGHLIYINNNKLKIRILPSGIFKKNCLCLLSDNVIISISNLINELLKINLIILNKIIISRNSLIILNIDEFIDYLIDTNLKIGTTHSGITICYLKKMIKCSLKFEDLIKLNFIKKIKKLFFVYNIFFIYFKLKYKFFFKQIYFILFFKIIKIMLNIINNNKFVNINFKTIFENSQGACLDIDYGTYPFVTCSNTLNKSVYINSKFYLNNIKHLGIFKSYLTRVGNGTFLSKYSKYKNLLFSLLNNEIGTNTNRIRSCGWLDIFSICKTIKLNNITNIIITKLDSLICFKKIKILIRYKLNTNNFNNNNNMPIYISLKSWKFINSKYTLNDLNFHLFIRYIEKYLNTPINIISIGKFKNDIIVL